MHWEILSLSLFETPYIFNKASKFVRNIPVIYFDFFSLILNFPKPIDTLKMWALN